MPIVELDDGRRVETDDTSPEAIDEIASHLGSITTESPHEAAGAYPQPGADVSITGALAETGRALRETASSVLGPPAAALTRLTSGPRGESSLGAAASDVFTVAGTALAPEVSAAQFGVGAAARTLAPEETAQTAETVTGAL